MVCCQLFLAHLASVRPQQLDGLGKGSKQVVHRADVGGAHHVVVRAACGVRDNAVDLRSVQKVSGCTLGVQVEKPLAHAGRRDVAVLVLLLVPPVEQKVRADLHQGKYRRLHHLACRRPAQALPSPLYLGLVLGALVGSVPRLLGLVVAHGVGQDAVVLEALGGKHGQRLYKLVVAALDARPLHGGVVGLGLLDDPLVHLVHGFPVGFAALLRGTLAELRCVVLHIPL